MVQLQHSILEHLHHHTLFNMFFNKISEAQCARILSCSGLGVGAWFITWLVFLAFWLFSPICSTTLCIRLGLPHPSIVRIPWCVCTHPSDPMAIHFLCYVHGNKCIGTHDVVCNTFVAIAWDVNFHMGRKQLHALPSTMINSFHRRVNIVLTKDDICTLANVVIANPMWIDLLPWICVIQRFFTLDVIQAKEKSYCNQHPTDQFLLLTIEVFGCSHKHVDVLLHDCANAIWSSKGPKGFHLSTLIIFFCQKISITL
jgi:hypothetical protein